MSAARDYEHDEWLPWYKEDTEGWLRLTLAARGAMAEIARKLNRRGEIHLRRGLSSLAFLLRLRWEGELEPAIAELVFAGKVTWDGARFTLSDPDFEARRRRSSADRMASKRARDKDKVTARATLCDVGDGSDVTPVTAVTVTPVLVSLVSSDPISDLGSDARPLDPPPTWWPDVIGQIAMQLGETVEPAAAWFRYGGHRAGKDRPPTAKDAVYWITSVIVPELKTARVDAARLEKRDASFASERAAKLGSAPKPENSTKTFRERDDWAKTAGPPDPATAERMRKLMGGVGR